MTPIARTIRPRTTVDAPRARIMIWSRVSSLKLTELAIDDAEMNNCNSATPAVTKPRLVLTYAKNVLSNARWSRATLPEFFNVKETLEISGIQNVVLQGPLSGLDLLMVPEDALDDLEPFKVATLCGVSCPEPSSLPILPVVC